MRNIFEDKSSHEIAVFIAKNMNKLLINENSYCVLCLFSDKTFLTIEKYYGEDGKNVRKGDYPGDGVMKFYGPQHPSVVDFIVNLVIDEEYDVNNKELTGYFETYAREEEFGEKRAKHVNKLYNLIERGRIEGQMALQRVPDSLINADMRKKIGRMTSQFGGAKKRRKSLKRKQVLPPKYD